MPEVDIVAGLVKVSMWLRNLFIHDIWCGEAVLRYVLGSLPLQQRLTRQDDVRGAGYETTDLDNIEFQG